MRVSGSSLYPESELRVRKQQLRALELCNGHENNVEVCMRMGSGCRHVVAHGCVSISRESRFTLAGGGAMPVRAAAGTVGAEGRFALLV